MTDRLDLGRREIQKVSPFCTGMVAEPDAILEAYDHGANFFFVSGDLHWPDYEATRKGLARLLARTPAVRDSIVVASAAYVTQSDFLAGPFDEILRAIPGLERIDVLIAGGAYRQDVIERVEILRSFTEDRLFGARAIGATFHDRFAAAVLTNSRLIDLTCVRYNPLHPGAAADLFPLFEPARGLVFSFNSTCGYVSASRADALGLEPDHWRPDVTDYYRFALSACDVDGILWAPRTPAHVQALAAALERGPLDEDERQYLEDLASVATGRKEIDRR